ncbi:Signal transduction histidine kinase [Roseateles sp. YR242]|uniref:ATP-binding protein n=1 Tax=Roseateles sp. YR242 TaxID=1855305 RepID=UPI0008D6B040|nr:ATP-binding protein [Roseateles sp. YR242]SEL10892.1 Signal transduction histidine kinase [Roseateles sp. YR242]
MAQPVRPGGTAASSFLLTRLVLIVAAVAAPLLLLLVVTLQADRRDAEKEAFGALKGRADKAAEEVYDILEQADHLLMFMASRPGVRKLDSGACQNLMGGPGSLSNSAYTNLGLLAPNGSMVCSTNAKPGLVDFSGEAWFVQGMAAAGLSLSKPLRGPISQRMVLYLTRPVTNEAGQRVALLALALDLAYVNTKLAPLLDGPDSSVGIRQGQRIFLTRLPEPERWMGQEVPKTLLDAPELASVPVRVGVGVSGSPRAFAVTPMKKYDLEAIAGMPSDFVYADANAQALHGAAAAAAAIVLGVGAAVFFARRLTAALRSITDTARALSAGATNVRADTALPGEFGEVASEFNRLMDRNDQKAADLRTSNAHAVRVRQIYETLSQTGQAIAHRVSGAGLFHVVCDVATRAGLATDARVVVATAQGLRTEVIAPADGTQGPQPEGAGQTPDAVPLHLVVEAVESGTPRHAVHADAGWIAVPFSTSGRPAGAILMRVSEGAMLDDETAGLMTELGRDISFGLDLERHREAEAALSAAEAANLAKSTFLSHVSHELKTPLNAVLGFAQLARSTPCAEADSEVRGSLDQVLAAGRQLRLIIDDLMDVSLIESGGVALDMAEINVAEVAKATTQQQEPAARTLGISLKLDITTEPVEVVTDGVRVRQILTNLVSNALKYNRPGGTVTVSMEPQAERVHIRVEDTGQGMSPAQLKGLFQAFNRLGRERSAVEGTGIGLFITKRLVDLLGGTLTFESVEGEGTVVTFCLPTRLAASPLQEPPADADPPDRRRELAASVVYIEDNPVNVILLEQWFRRYPGIALTTAETGHAGLAACHELKPDLVLLDMQLPDMTGVEVLKQLRQNPRTADLRVVALSANTLPADIQEALTAGAMAYWPKPVDFDRMETDLAEVLADRP